MSDETLDALKKFEATTRQRYETYQQLMIFCKEVLPAKGWHVMKMQPIKDYVPIPLYLDGDKLENMVRRFLRLPTVQHDRRELDKAVARIRVANAKGDVVVASE